MEKENEVLPRNRETYKPIKSLWFFHWKNMAPLNVLMILLAPLVFSYKINPICLLYRVLCCLFVTLLLFSYFPPMPRSNLLVLPCTLLFVCYLFVSLFVCCLLQALFICHSFVIFLFPPMPRSNLPVVACTFGLMLSSGKIFKWSFRGFSVLKLSLHCLKYPATLFLIILLLKVQCKDESWALDGGAYVMLWTRLLQRMLLKEKLKSDVLFCKMLSWVQWRWARTRWAAEFAILLWWLQKDPGAIVLNVGGISLRSRLHMRTLTFIQRQYDHFTKHSWMYPQSCSFHARAPCFVSLEKGSGEDF